MIGIRRNRRAEPATVATAAEAAPGNDPDPELLALRERLTERFAVMQSELGGLFYEMAIRDHVRMEVLIPKAAALQRLDAELGQVERLLREPDAAIGGTCSSCGATFARGAAFCSQCAQPLSAA
jgi:hypothetical protein